MTMLQRYAHMVNFFSSFEWWKADPHDELVNQGHLLLGGARKSVRNLFAARRYYELKA
jgi:hypothetical protein